jgi:LuxR family maltose regulon positive regulatory protein
VLRPRLVERLNAGLGRSGLEKELGFVRKLTLVSAPAGFGKTTLLSVWVAGCGWPVAWVSLDEDDNDPTRFWAYFIAALQTVCADVGKSAPAVLQSPQPPPIEVLLTGVINKVAVTPDPFVLVLDDYHVIVEQRIHDALTFLVDNMPPQMHLVLSGRADPPWPLARMRARREVIELRAGDLRFTPEEAAAFLNDVMGLGLSMEDVATLDTRTEGWIASLQLAALAIQRTLSVQGREDVSAFIRAFGGSHRLILDYLVEEVLDRQPPAIQEFLLKTSILERMTGPLCDAVCSVGTANGSVGAAVTGRDDGQAVLVRLDQDNLFLVPLDGERRWYRYHRLFADLLRSRLRQTWPDYAPMLHRRASEWYEGAGFIEEAVAHAFAGGDIERAASLVERHAMHMIVNSKAVTLSWWIEALPDDLVRARPWLCVYRAWTQYWIGRREQVEECLQSAEQALQSMPLPSDDGKRIAGHIAVIRAYNALVNEEISRVSEMAQTALELVPEGEYMHCMAALILGGANWGRGDVVAAQQAFTKANMAAQKCGYRFLVVSTAYYVGMQQAKQARLYEAFETYRQALELATEASGQELPVAGFPSVRLGDLSREWNDLETASRNLTKGVELCVQWGQADALADGYIALARLQLAQGNLEEAISTLRKAEHLVQRAKVDPWVTCWLDDCRLRLWLATGNLTAAVRWARTSGPRVDGELSYLHDLNHVNLARLLVAQGVRQPSGSYLEQALGLLARLLEAAETAGWINEAIQVLVLQALALQARGDGEGALSALARALDLAEPGGYVRTFVDEGAPIGGLLRQVVARGIAVGYAGELLAALEGETKDERRGAEPHSPPLVDPLSEREMEVLRLLTTSLSSPEIAQELFISVTTVRSHIRSIYSKLSVHRRMDAIQRAKELGLL